MQQNNSTVGVRGSLSTHSEPLEVPGFPKLNSFAQELVDLGVSKGAIKRICKQVVLKTLEVHGHDSIILRGQIQPDTYGLLELL